MEQYIKDRNKAGQLFLGQLLETIVAIQNTVPENGLRPLKVNSRMKRFIAEKRYIAKESFLESIHREIYAAKPQWERDAIEADRAALARGDTELDEDLATVDRPELTTEYLKSIGREDLSEWGSGA